MNYVFTTTLGQALANSDLISFDDVEVEDYDNERGDFTFRLANEEELKVEDQEITFCNGQALVKDRSEVTLTLWCQVHRPLAEEDL